MTEDHTTRAIPGSGERLPVVGLGTWQTFDVDAPLYGERQQLIEAFVGLGGRVVDSSPMYGRAEATVGAVATAAGVHDTLFLATKVWTNGKAAGVRQIESSFGKLATDRIDLLQVHNLVDVDTHLETFRGLKAEGRIRYTGVTHYAASAHNAVEDVIRRVRVDFLQINYSVDEREAEERLLPLAADRGMAVLINRPFAEGALLRRLRHRAVPSWAAEIGCASWPQLLLAFVLSHPAVTCVIPATADLEHLRDNMAAAAAPLADASLRERIVQATR